MSRMISLIFAALFLTATTSQAKEIKLPYKGITLNANLEMADGRGHADGVVLITHDTLADYATETIAGLQRRLKDRGYSSLAINLSLGVDDRRDVYNCATLQTHKHTDAIGEIDAWLTWLKEQGAREVVLLGYSRGGNQSALYVRKNDNPVIRKLVLVAPITWSLDRMADRYKDRFGAALYPLIGKAAALVLGGKGETVMEKVGFLECPKARVTADSFFGYYRNDSWLDTPEMLDGINRPVLVVAGSEDKLIPDLAEKVEGKGLGNVRMRVIDGAGHLFHDKYADALADVVAGFIGGNY